MTVENVIALRDERGEEGVAYDRTDQPVSLPAVNGKRQRERERERRGREKIKKKEKRKEERSACLKGAWCDSIAKDSSSTG